MGLVLYELFEKCLPAFDQATGVTSLPKTFQVCIFFGVFSVFFSVFFFWIFFFRSLQLLTKPRANFSSENISGLYFLSELALLL
jgi:hypothetical protein